MKVMMDLKQENNKYSEVKYNKQFKCKKCGEKFNKEKQMRKHKQNHHTGYAARSNMKNDDVETANRRQSCKKKFADNTLKYHRPFKCKKCKLIDATVEDNAGIPRNEETAYNTGRNVAEPENDTIIDTNLKDEEIASNSEGRNDSNLDVSGKHSSGQTVDEHEATFNH